jgi:hypothetical protein
VTLLKTAWDAGAIDLRDLRSSYEDYIKDMLVTPMHGSRFGEFIRGIGFTRTRPWVGVGDDRKQQRHYTLGTLKGARALFDEHYNTNIDWLGLDGEDDDAAEDEDQTGGHDMANVVALPLKAAA